MESYDTSSRASSSDCHDKPARGWAKLAEPQADWFLSRVVVRHDVHGRYKPDGGQYTAHEPLSRELLIRHCRGELTIGVHSTSPDGRCLSVAFDIDAHDDQADPDANWRCALAAAKELASYGLKPLIFDSNGKGGYHVRAFFKKPLPVAVAYWLCQRVIACLAADEFAPVEAFPKQGELTLDRPYGNWLRLPGKHHKRDHWTRIYDPESGVWHEGESAVRRLIKVPGDDTSALAKTYEESKPKPRPEESPRPRQDRRRHESNGDRPTEAEVRSALDYLPDSWADSYGGTRADTGWLGTLMALHDWDPVRGLTLAHGFSARCQTKYDRAVVDAKWATFTQGGGLTVKTIFKAAMERGWQPSNGKARGKGRNGATSKPSANGKAKVAPGPDDGTPTDDRIDILITADFHETVDRTSAALVGHPAVFERGTAPVKVIRKEESDPDDMKGVKRPAGAPQIVILSQESARTIASRLARFWGFDKRSEEWVRKPPPGDVLASVLKEGHYPGARELVGVIESPTIRTDGSLLDRPGYDPPTGLLYLPNAEYPAIPEHPTLAQIQKAALDLLYLVHDFPFKNESDRAAWLALVLTLVVRSAIAGPVPAWLFSSNVAGSGKSLLVVLAALIATGRPPAYDGYADDDAEMEKRLGAVALLGDPVLLLDNAASGTAVGGAALDRAILAKGSYRVRMLGKTEMSPLVPWRTAIAVTGNNLSTKSDGLRRFIGSFLESTMERPETRDPAKFRVTIDTGLALDQYVLRERARLVAAALTIVRGHIAAKRPKAELNPMDFPEWDSVIRQSIHYATDIDPAGSGDKLQADDEKTREQRQVVSAWWNLCVELDREGTIGRDFKKDGATAGEAAAAMNRRFDANFMAIKSAFAKATVPRSTLIDPTKLGHILKRNRDVPTPCGKIFVSGLDRNGGNIWAVTGQPPE